MVVRRGLQAVRFRRCEWSGELRRFPLAAARGSLLDHELDLLLHLLERLHHVELGRRRLPLVHHQVLLESVELILQQDVLLRHLLLSRFALCVLGALVRR